MASLADVAVDDGCIYNVRGVRCCVQKYGYRDKKSELKTGESAMVTLVGSDPECYMQGSVACTTAAHVGNVNDALRQFKTHDVWSMSKIAFSHTGAKFVGAPLKNIINLKRTNLSPIMKNSNQEKYLSLSTLPPSTCAMMSGRKESGTVDFIGIVRDVSNTSYVQGKPVRNVVLVDGSRSEGSERLASLTLGVWGHELVSVVNGNIRGSILSVYNARAQYKKEVLTLNTLDDMTQLEFPERIINFRPTRLVELIRNSSTILAEADGTGVTDVTTTFFRNTVYATGLATHSVCAIAAKALESETDFEHIPRTRTLYQLCFATADLPVEMPLTKDKSRIFFGTVVRDHTGSVQMGITEAAALGMAQNCSTKDEFIDAWKRKSLTFLPSNIRFLQREREFPFQPTFSFPEKPYGAARRYTELIATDAVATSLSVAPSDAARDVLGFLKRGKRTTGAVAPTYLENVHNCAINGLAIKSNGKVHPVNKLWVFIKGKKGCMSRTEDCGDKSQRVITEDVISPYWESSEVIAHGKRQRFNVVAWTGYDHCAALINSKHAIISVVQVSLSRKEWCGVESALDVNLIVDAVLPVKKDLKGHLVAWKGYVANVVFPGEEPETGTIRKCRKLEHCPSNTLFPNTPPLCGT